MNKKLIAIAVASVMAAPAAMAADVTMSGRVNQQFISQDVDGGGSTLNNKDNGHGRLQFDVKAGKAFGRMATDFREGKIGSDRERFVGYNFSGAKLTYGRMANAGKNIEKDPLIATFLETRSSVANANPSSAYSSNGFISEVAEVSMKAGGATIKVQLGLSDGDAEPAGPGARVGDTNQGYVGVSATGKAGGVRWWISHNNDAAETGEAGDAAPSNDDSNFKVGASMKFGKVATSLNFNTHEDNGFATEAITIRANMGLGGGAKVYAGLGLRSDDSGAAGDATWLRVAYSKTLSKGATVYAGYTNTDYDTAGPADVSQLGVGMTIKF